MNEKDKEIIDDIDFDKIREDISNIIGLSKEKLFPMIYGDEKTKKEYEKFCEILMKKYSKGLEEIAQKYEKKIKELEKGKKVIKIIKGQYTTLTPEGLETVFECEVGVDKK